MKKLSFVCAIVILLAGMSAQAQKNSTLKPIDPPIFQLDNIIIEDDASGNFLIIAPTTGEYKFQRCRDGFSMSGVGVVRLDGCLATFEDSQPDHRVLASINLCTQEAKAIVEKFAPIQNTFSTNAMKELLSDANLGDNTLSCSKK